MLCIIYAFPVQYCVEPAEKYRAGLSCSRPTSSCTAILYCSLCCTAGCCWRRWTGWTRSQSRTRSARPPPWSPISGTVMSIALYHCHLVRAQVPGRAAGRGEAGPALHRPAPRPGRLLRQRAPHHVSCPEKDDFHSLCHSWRRICIGFICQDIRHELRVLAAAPEGGQGRLGAPWQTRRRQRLLLPGGELDTGTTLSSCGLY